MNMLISQILSHVNEKQLNFFLGPMMCPCERGHCKPLEAVAEVFVIPDSQFLEYGILRPGV